MLQYWWIPCVCIMYGLYGWLTKQNNANDSTLWFWLLTICGALPVWSIVSRTSKNLLTDGFIYDFFMLIAYVGMLVYLEESEKFILNQWIGFIFCIIGILLMKVKLF